MKHIPEKFQPYLGNNHILILSSATRGGGISFGMHIGKKLSDRLYEDLTERLGVINIRIYLPGDAEWTDNPPCSSARIYLNGKGLINDIFISGIGISSAPPLQVRETVSNICRVCGALLLDDLKITHWHGHVFCDECKPAAAAFNQH